MRYLNTMLLFFTFFLPFTAFAQEYQDCSTALNICGKGVLQFTLPPGPGEEDEIGESACTTQFPLSESFPTWITWTVATAGNLEFVIVPDFELADIDFFVYRLTAPGQCEGQENVRCMTSGENVGEPPSNWERCTGPTGLIAGETDAAELPGCQGDDNNFLAPLEVEAGEAYALLIENFSGAGGFTFELCGTATLPCDSSNCSMLSSIAETPVAQQLDVWPNPAKEVLYLSLSAPSAAYNASIIQLFSLSGQLVRQWGVPLSGERQELGLRGISSGAYLLRVQSGGYAGQRLVVVAR